MNAATYDVVIVGAGIVGAACAWECAARKLRVAVVDLSTIGGGATAAGMGHIVVMDDSEAQFALTRYSQQLWRDLRSELPDDVEYVECGTIWVAADDQELQEVDRKKVFYSERGVPVEVLSGRDLENVEPHLRKGMAGGLLVPEDGVLYPPCAARFLLERAQEYGTTVHMGAPVVELGQGRVRRGDGSELYGGVIVNAAGAWSPELTPGIKVKKRKGHLVITDRYPGFVHPTGRARLPKECAFGQRRFGGVQRAAAPHRSVAHRFFASVRGGASGSGPWHPRAHGGACRALHASLGGNLCHPSVDRVPCSHAGQVTAHRSLGGRLDGFPCNRT